MEASALRAPAGQARTRFSAAAPLLRWHTDEQLVRCFRAGEDEAFKVIYDRYRQRLFAYARQMLHCRQDAEDALQDVFVRAYSGLRADDRDLALRAWLYRVAHNRCVDELRRPPLPVPGLGEFVRPPDQDPITQAEQRESLRRLIADVRRLPEQQRSALLMRELTGMSYLELAGVLAISIPAVKSLLVRARVGLAQAADARDTACGEIRHELVLAHDGRRRPAALARRHLRDCVPCREFRGEVRGISQQLAGLVPAVGPAAVVANLLGFGSGAGSGAAAGGSAAAGSGALAGGGLLAAGAGHAVTLLAAAVVTVGGAAEIQHTLSSASSSSPHAATVQHPVTGTSAPTSQAVSSPPASTSSIRSAPAAASTASGAATQNPLAISRGHTPPAHDTAGSGAAGGSGSLPIDPARLDPGMGPGPIGGADVTGGGSGSPTSGGGEIKGPTGSASSTAAAAGGGATSTIPSNGTGSGSSPDSSQSGSPSSVTPSVGAGLSEPGSSSTLSSSASSSSGTSGSSAPGPSRS